MGQLSLVPRHPRNPCTVDCHTALPTANRKWRHCFSVQVNSRFLTVPVLQAASYCLMTYCVLLKRKGIKKHITHAKWGSRNGTEVCVILANSACCHTFCKPPLVSSRIPRQWTFLGKPRLHDERLLLNRKPTFFSSSIRVLNLTSVKNHPFYFTYFNIHFEMEFHFRQWWCWSQWLCVHHNVSDRTSQEWTNSWCVSDC